MTNINEEITSVSCSLLTTEPFFGHFFAGLIKEVSEKVDTAAVGQHGDYVKLYVNPNFWENHLNPNCEGIEDLKSVNVVRSNSEEKSWRFRYKVGVIKHEILHIVFKHIFRMHDYPHRDLFNIAADLVVNQYILPNQLIKGLVMLSNFPELKLEKDQEVGYYYNKLLNLLQEADGDLSSLFPEKSEDSNSGGSPNQNSQGEGSNSEGSNSGETPNQNSEEGKESKENSGGGSQNNSKGDPEKREWDSYKELRKYINNGACRQSHQFWEWFSKLSSAQKQIIEDAVNKSIKNSVDRMKTKGWGDCPAGLKIYLEEFEQSLIPTLDWRRCMKTFANTAQKTYIKNTIKKPSRRYGTNPGIKIKHRCKILVAIDTSGSVSNDEILEFFSEIKNIYRTNCEIRIVECDTHIHQAWDYKGVMPDFVLGAGGTCFEAPLEYNNEEYKADAIIFFTDGGCSAPETPCRCPLLWMISTNADCTDFPGRVVYMK